MFDTRAMATGHARNLAVELDERADSATRRAGLRLVGERVTPMALAREQTLPVLGPLAPLFPEGALRRGSIVGIQGSGATSLAMAVAEPFPFAGSDVELHIGTDRPTIADMDQHRAPFP